MGTFKDDILEAANGEEIIGVVIGEFGWGGYDSETKGRNYHRPITPGKLMTWEEAAPLLDYEYDTGYGAPDCHAINVWTTNSVLFIVQYDGATSIDSVPRNPTDNYLPDMPGG